MRGKLISLITLATIQLVQPAVAHRDPDPATNLVMTPGVTCISNGTLSTDYAASYAIANPARDGDPQYSFVKSCWHSNNRLSPSNLAKLTITFPQPVTFNYIAWNSGGTAGSYWHDSGQTTEHWTATLDGVTIVDKDDDRGGSSLSSMPYQHDPCGPAPDGDQDERAVLSQPVTGQVVVLSFNPISRSGGYYWSVRDINVGTTDPPADYKGDPMDLYNVTWTSPSTDYNGSMPIGNGDIALNAWVESGGDLMLLIAKSDAWDENCRLVKLGRVRIKLTPNPFTAGLPFAQTLRLRQGEILIMAGQLSSQVTLRVWVDANQPVIRVEAQGKSPVSVQASLELWRTVDRELIGKSLDSAYGLQSYAGNENPDPQPVISRRDTVLPGSGGRVVWLHRNPTSIWQSTMSLQGLSAQIPLQTDPLLNRAFGAIMAGTGMTNQSSTSISSTATTDPQLVSIYVLTSQAASDNAWHTQAQAVRSQVDAKSLETARVDHQNWWNDFWNRSWIRVSKASQGSGVDMSQGYALQRFVTACAGRGAFPIKFNGTLFTIGSTDELGLDPDYRLWGGPYWQQNTRLMYWPMLASGDFEMMRPYFSMFKNALPTASARTQAYFGHDGAYFPEVMYFWGTYTNTNYYWDRTGHPISWIGEAFIRYHYTGSLELLAMMLDYYAYTGDSQFMQNDLLPLADALLTFWDQHYSRNLSGQIVMEPAQALETWHDVVNPTPDVAGLRWVLDGLLALPDSTIGSERRTNWTRFRGEIPPIPLGGTTGSYYVKPASVVRGGISNYENPELYAVFPFKFYGIGKPDLSIGTNTFSRRTYTNNFCWTQDPIQAALLGLSDQARTMLAQRYAAKDASARFPAFWGPNYDWTPDEDHGGVANMALQTMLMQCDGITIRLLPAWPDNLDVNFKLRAPQSTTVEGRFVGGKLIHLKVSPESRRKDVTIMKPTSIPIAKEGANDSSITCGNVVVSAVHGSYHFHVQELDRSAGILVVSNESLPTVTEGELVSVQGTLTTISGERAIEATAVVGL